MRNSVKHSINHFLQRKILPALLFGLATLFSSGQLQAQYVHTDGTKIVDGNNNPIFFAGMNLGNWLVWEGYLMMGDYNFRTHTQYFNSLKNVLGGMDKAMAFERQWRLNYVTEQSIVDIKNLGFNSVRVPFNYNMFWFNGAVSDGGFEYFDRLVEYCRKNNVYILLDMHAAPGYQNPGDHSDNINSNANQPRDSVKFWDGNNVDIASKVWRHIANRYKNEPIIWGYDLLNEPVPQDGREYELLPSLIKIRNAIREVDNNHIIVAEASWWASDMSKIDWSNPTTQSRTGVYSKWDNNLVYETHHYVFGNTAWLEDLYARDDVTNRLGIPLILGEMGEDTPQILRTMSDWATKNIAGYFPWSFKKMSHDRTLWTIQPNDIYNQVKNSINSGEYFVNGAAEGMLSFTQHNISNGSPGLQWHQDFYDGVRPINVPTTPPPPVTTASGPLTLFQNCNYGGNAANVPLGDHNLGSLQNRGAANDQVSSFKIAPGFILEFFQHDNFGGWMYSATTSDDCLENEGRSDQLSSLKLRANGTPNLANRYYLKNRKSGLFMDVKDFSTANGALILQWHFHGGTNQQFDFVDRGNGSYAIRSVVSGKTIDIDAIGMNNGAKALQWDFVGGGNQIFVARKADGNFYQLVATHSAKVLEIMNGSSEPSANVQQYDNNNQTTSHWELIPVDGAKLDYKREAEDYSASSGVQLETTTDPAGGNRNVGWIDAGDWLAYTAIKIPTSGYYTVEYRVATPLSGKTLSLDLNAGAIKLGDVTIPNTGGWQNWQTVSHRVFINAGTYDLGIFTPTGGWNINWFRIVSQ